MVKMITRIETRRTERLNCAGNDVVACHTAVLPWRVYSKRISHWQEGAI